MTSDNTICQAGTPNGMRTIITIGEVNGNNELHKAIPLSGDCTLYIPRYSATMMMTVTGTINC